MKCQDVGDDRAPIGSIGWLKAMRSYARVALDNEEIEARMIENSIEALRRDDGFKKLGFERWEDFCKASDKEGGLGHPAEAITVIIERRKAAIAVAEEKGKLAKHGGDRKGEKDQGDNVTLKRGNDSSYLARRLLRDAPEIFERLKAGEFKSVRAAAIEAGIVKVPTALDILRRAWKKATPIERKQFLETIS